MLINHNKWLLLIIIILLLPFISLYSQENKVSKKTFSTTTPQIKFNISPTDSLQLMDIPDSLKKAVKLHIDSLKIEADSISGKKKSKSGIDSTVVYSAKDSVIFKIKKKSMWLYGNSKLNYKTQKLDAEKVTLDFNESTLSASGTKDTNNKTIGFPKFVDSGEEFVGEKIRYNFKTNKGTITLGETQMNEGFYFAEKIKRVSQDELFGEDGYYTTCDAPHPHYYFGSPKMKVIAKDKVFIDPIIFYVEDMPIFLIPFGLYFPNKAGRQSGLLIPAFFFSKNRGVVFNDFGVYLALSDYYDTKFTTDLYSKGGYIVKNDTRWIVRDKLQGSLSMSYGRTRLTPDDPFSEDYSFVLNHNQAFTPQARIDVGLNFRSQNYNQKTSFNLYDRQTQNMSSRASFSKSFDNGSSFSISYSRDQNIINNDYSQSSPVISFALPNWKPLSSIVSSNSSFSWLKDISFNYSLNANQFNNRTTQITSPTDSTRDTNIVYSHQTKISHSPSISISPKFGYFTIQPSVSLQAANYFRKSTKTYDAKDSTVHNSYQYGFFTEYRYSIGVNLSTRVFGILKPTLFGLDNKTGIVAMRHTYQPSIGFSYTPDQSDPSQGFYDTYYDIKQKQTIKYSRYADDGGGLASRYLSKSLSYSDMHSFEIKIKQGDTLPDKNLELLRLNFGTSYNFAADSLKLNDISVSFRSPALTLLNFSGSAQFTPYDDAEVLDTNGTPIPGRYTKINQFLLSNSKGLARLTNISFEISTSFSSQGVSLSTFGEEKKEEEKKDSVSLGERFTRKMEQEDKLADLFADNSPGYSPITVPWNVNMGLSFSYGRQFSQSPITRNISLRASLSFQLTPTWSVDATTIYDFVRKELLSTSFNIRKNLHCWELLVTWYPTGYSQGFYVKFGIKAPQLNDLKIEKRNSPIY
jgi:hypothetical protein